ncbi:MAG: hypothetical protein ACR2ID_11125 [Chthoniobacterales bacterium]
MKKSKLSQAGFQTPRVLIALGCSAAALALALLAFGVYPGTKVQAQTAQTPQPQPGAAQVIPLVGPFSQDLDLNALPYVPTNGEEDETRRMRHPLPQTASKEPSDPEKPVRQSDQPSAMPTPSISFNGVSSTQSGCGCLPPDTQGDVGPNHYIQSVNSSIKIFDKSGNPLNGTNGTTYNAFFAPIGPTNPCGQNQNQGDGFVFYDQIANRWVVTDFAFPPTGAINYQCVGVSKTADPVSGGWWLYAVQVDPANPTWLGDYPKFALWPDAYHFTVNLFDQVDSSFKGVRVYALDRASMINGTGAPNPGAVAFTIAAATLGDSYSLVPASFRTGSAPPAGRDEYLLSIDSPATGGVVLTQVHTWRFHVDFATPSNSTLGLGANHAPNANITVAGFVDAFTDTASNLVPQTGTTRLLDTLGDKIMSPVVYQNRGGTESLWAAHTVNNNQNGTGPTAIRWYQFDVTGSTIPATPVQQQTFNNAGDGLWRWMPSIAVDANGNMSIGYTTSSSTTNPAINYAGRLAGDPLNTLAQGEGLLIQGAGHQTSTSGRWGDYSSMTIDPSDNLTFWHTNEYYSVTSSAGWNTRIGAFKFPAAPLTLTTAVSRKSHGAGTFDIPIPGSTECRNSGGNHQLVFTFSNNIVSGNAAVTSGTGSVTGTPTAAGNTLTVNLTGVTDAQQLGVTLSNVTDTSSQTLPNTVVNVRFLIGDTTDDRVVNGGDSVQTRGRAGQPADATNFRSDVNLDGTVNGGDAVVVRANAGHSVP